MSLSFETSDAFDEMLFKIDEAKGIDYLLKDRLSSKKRDGNFTSVIWDGNVLFPCS